MSARPIYLDYQATTPCDPRVVAAMLPYFTETFGNPHSLTHAYGREADMAVKGAAHFHRQFSRDHVVTLATEHKCVLESTHALEAEGFKVTYLPVQRDGLVDLALLDAAIDARTALVSVMAAHNEIGVIQPLTGSVAYNGVPQLGQNA